MKQTLTTHDIADALKRDENAGWSWQGALALAQYLEELEQDTGEELELDVVAIRCDYSEYAGLKDWAEDYFSDWTKDLPGYDKYAEELERAEELEKQGYKADAEDVREYAEEDLDGRIREYIHDRGQLIEFSGGIIVSSF